MISKRVVVATIVGILCGLFCASGAYSLGLATELFPLLAIVYNRALIGFAVGIADIWKTNPILRGAVIGILISLDMAIAGQGWILLAFGAIYGILADVIATKLG